MYEVITRWSSGGSSGGLTIMYADQAVNLADLRTALGTFWNALDNSLTTSTTWTVDTGGRTLDETTGTLTGFWSEPTVQAGVGALSGSAVANASQVLVRWRTTAIVAGRLVQGRTYVPGLGAGLLANGEIAGTTRNGMAAAAENLADSASSISIWSRPKAGRPGSLHPVSSGDVWGELAVQRRRRD